MKYTGNKNSARIVTLSDLGTHIHTHMHAQNTSSNKNDEIKDTHQKEKKRKNKVIKRKEITLDALAAD